MLQQLSNQIRQGILSTLGKLARNDATGGVAMLICTVLALILQNGSYSTSYRHWLDMTAGIRFGEFVLEKPLLLWINDGLITIFFFSIGLELKIEFIKGHLSDIRNVILPSLAAVGGIVAPSLVFILFNHGDDFAMNGWAIPTATDTAFSVGLILLLGKRVPASLKIFLLSMAIFDDIGAILVIALFYTSALSIPALIGATFSILGLAFLNYLKVGRSLLYLIFGILLWFSILKSGVHATLAGIITAFFIPMQDDSGKHMVEDVFEALKVWVAMVVLPIFTIANAGVDLSSISLKDFLSPVSLGIFFGLVLGKQLGIFGVVLFCLKTKLVKMPEDANLKQIYGVCILTGIGFSMSMFIDTLAYQGSNVFNYSDSLAILMASLVSGTAGFLFLRFYACKTKEIEYRPWLPGPAGYRGNATTANLYSLEPKVGPSSVAPTAVLVAAANARVAAANAALHAANKAAAAAAEVAEAVQQVVSNKDDDESVAKVQAAAAAAAAAAADAAVTSTQLDSSEEHEDNMDVVQSAAGAAQQAAEVALEVAEAAKAEAQEAKAKAEAEKAEAEKAAAEEKADTEGKQSEESDNKESSDSKKTDIDSAEGAESENSDKDDSALPSRIIKTVAKVAIDTASMAADVASSILSKDDESEDKKDSKEEKSDKGSNDAKAEKSDEESKKSKTDNESDSPNEVDAESKSDKQSGKDKADSKDIAGDEGEESDKDDSALPTRIIKTVAKVAMDTASMAADVASSILSKDDESDKETKESKTDKSDKEAKGSKADKSDKEAKQSKADKEQESAQAQGEVEVGSEDEQTAKTLADKQSDEDLNTADDKLAQVIEKTTSQTEKQANDTAANSTALDQNKLSDGSTQESVQSSVDKQGNVDKQSSADKQGSAKKVEEAKATSVVDTAIVDGGSASNFAQGEKDSAQSDFAADVSSSLHKQDNLKDSQEAGLGEDVQSVDKQSADEQTHKAGESLESKSEQGDSELSESKAKLSKSELSVDETEQAKVDQVESEQSTEQSAGQESKTEVESQESVEDHKTEQGETVSSEDDADEDEGELITLDVTFSIPSNFPDDEDGDLAEDVVVPKSTKTNKAQATIAESAQQIAIEAVEKPDSLTPPALADLDTQEHIVKVVAQAQLNTLVLDEHELHERSTLGASADLAKHNLNLEDAVAESLAYKSVQHSSIISRKDEPMADEGTHAELKTKEFAPQTKQLKADDEQNQTAESASAKTVQTASPERPASSEQDQTVTEGKESIVKAYESKIAKSSPSDVFKKN